MIEALWKTTTAETREASFIRDLSAMGNQRDITGSNNIHASTSLSRMVDADGKDPSEYHDALYSLTHNNLTTNYTSGTIPEATKVCLEQERFSMLADVHNAMAKPEDHAIITTLLSLDTFRKNAPEKDHVSLSQTLMRITYEMQQRNPHDLRLYQIAHAAIRQLDMPHSKSTINRSEEDQQLRANLLHTLHLTHSDKASSYLNKRHIPPEEYDIQQKIPQNKSELTALLIFTSQTERIMEAGHELDIASTCQDLLQTTENSEQWNDTINGNFIYGHRDPYQDFLSLTLPKTTQILLTNNRPDLIAKIANAVAKPEDYQIITSVLGLPQVKEDTSPEGLVTQQLLTKALIRIECTMRQDNPQDSRLHYIARFIITNIQEGVPPHIAEDLLYCLHITQTPEGEQFMEKAGLEPADYDEKHLPDDYFESYSFGDPAWNEFYFGALHDFETANWENKLSQEAYMEILETHYEAVEQKLTQAYYFEKLMDTVPSLYSRDPSAHKRGVLEENPYQGLHDFGRKFIYEHLDVIETMMLQIDKPARTKVVMHAVEDLYDTGEDISNTEITDFLLKNLDFALNQKDAYLWYTHETINKIYAHANPEQIKEANALFTHYYTTRNVQAMRGLPLGTILQYQETDQLEQTQQSIIAAYADRDSSVTNITTPQILRLYYDGNLEGKELFLKVIQTNMSFNDFVTTLNESTKNDYIITRTADKNKMTYAEALNWWKKYQGENSIDRIMNEYGLSHDRLLVAWENSSNGHDSTGRHFSEIVAMENKRVGIANRLFRQFNVRCFKDGDEKRFLQQDEQREQQGPWELRLVATYDYSIKRAWNYPVVHKKRAAEAENVGLLHRTVEWTTEKEALVMLTRLTRTYGAPEILILEGHSDEHTMVGQEIMTTLANMTKGSQLDGAISTDNVRRYSQQFPDILPNVLKPETTIVMMGCAPTELSRELAIATGCTVIVSDKIISASGPSMEITRDDNGRYAPIVDYGKSQFDKETGIRPKVNTIIYDGTELQKTREATPPRTPVISFPEIQEATGVA